MVELIALRVEILVMVEIFEFLTYYFKENHNVVIGNTRVIQRNLVISTNIKLKMLVCMSVCLFTFFSSISKPIGTPFATKLLFTPGNVLTLKYI